MLRAILSFALICLPIHAGEYAVFSSGLRLHVDRHESSGDIVRLYCNGGITELPAAAITAFEDDDYVPPPPAPETNASDSKKTEKNADPVTLVRQAAASTGLPAAFVESVAEVESGFNPNAVSPKGAVGVMQLMPGTARTLGVDPKNPEQNIAAGARLLRELLVKYGGDVVKALAAYNAGEAAVDRFQGMPPYAETQHYVDKVVRDYIRNGGK